VTALDDVHVCGIPLLDATDRHLAQRARGGHVAVAMSSPSRMSEILHREQSIARSLAPFGFVLAALAAALVASVV
jgi:hypothetical protein